MGNWLDLGGVCITVVQSGWTLEDRGPEAVLPEQVPLLTSEVFTRVSDYLPRLIDLKDFPTANSKVNY